MPRLQVTRVRLEHLAVRVDQARFRLRPPERGGLVLLQLDTQAIRELAAHRRLPHPGHLLEDLARALQVHGKEVAGQTRGDVRAQGRHVAVRHVALHHDAADREDRMPHRPPHERREQHRTDEREQRRGGDVHQLDVDGGLQGGGAFHVAAGSLSWSSVAMASSCRHRSS
jgi:hypothetical protein